MTIGVSTPVEPNSEHERGLDGNQPGFTSQRIIEGCYGRLFELASVRGWGSPKMHECAKIVPIDFSI